jgi:hypothetical protein
VKQGLRREGEWGLQGKWRLRTLQQLLSGKWRLSSRSLLHRKRLLGLRWFQAKRLSVTPLNVTLREAAERLLNRMRPLNGRASQRPLPSSW